MMHVPSGFIIGDPKVVRLDMPVELIWDKVSETMVGRRRLVLELIGSRHDNEGWAGNQMMKRFTAAAVAALS